MEMFSARLQKLEKDLNLISTIQNILTSEDEEGPRASLQNLNFGPKFSQDLPERDCNPRPHVLIGENSRKNGKKSTAVINRKKVIRSDNHMDGEAASVSVGAASKEDEILLEKVEDERRRRMEVEKSAGRVALKLQKTEDDLEREKETKRNLLVGTLELKNQLQSYDNTISHLQSQIDSSLIEKNTLSSNFENLLKEKSRIENEFKSKSELLDEGKNILEKQNGEMQQELRIIQKRCESLQQECQRKEESLSLQDQRLVIQLDQAVSRSAQIEKDKEELTLQLKESIAKYEDLQEKSSTKISHYKLMESNLSSQIQEKTSHIKRFESDWKSEKDQLQSQITSATNLVYRTKSFITSLQEERDSGLKELNQLQSKSEALLNQKVQLETNKKLLTQEISSLKDRLANLLRNDLEKTRISQEERKRMETELTVLKVDNQQVSKNYKILNSQLEIQKCQSEEERVKLQGEIVNLKTELKRIQDNFQVLQKISEDQGRTITKQRGDLDKSQDLIHNLQIELREATERGKVLGHELSSEHKSCLHFQSQVSQLESQLNSTEQELRDHNCEDFVESKWKSRVDEMEAEVQSRFVGWKRSTRSLEQERDLALTAARKALKQSEEIKDCCERRIIKMKSTSIQQVDKIEEEKREILKEKSKKIQSLETEVVQLRQSYGQMQRGYGTKVQQLQTALNACLVNPSQSFSNFPCYSGFNSDLGNVGIPGPF